MRPIRNGGKEAGGGNLLENQSLAQLWDAWEIHCLILVSLFLQVFLFLTAGMRRCSSSRVLGTVLWLAYLSADSVAIFVLGHLAVHAEEPGHQLMSFWAPFVLVHLGGQDTITALSKQDNELWRRHLLSLVSQVAVASYVVSMATWPDHRLLRAAMVIMFLSGSLKYAERTLCLYFASPERLRSDALLSLSGTLWQLTQAQGREGESSVSAARRSAEETLAMMSNGSISGMGIDGSVFDIMSVDAPFNKVNTILVARDLLPGMLAGFLSRADRCRAYEYVGARLVRCYQCIYTKTALREACGSVLWELVHDCRFSLFKLGAYCLVLCTLFQYASTPIALALFAAADKGHQIHPISRADITVSYVLLIGAIVLDVCSAVMFIFSYLSFILPASSRYRSVIQRVVSCIQFAGCRNKQWSEELAQYSMIKRHTVQDTAGMASSIRQSISRCLGAWGVELFEVTHTPITKDQAPIKEFILDNLLRSGERKEWNISSSRGQKALARWKGSHNDQDPDCARKAKALEKSIRADFPTAVLIWHIATDMCYYGDRSSTDDSDDQMTKHKNMSRQLSNYIMYLVFKCDVMLTSNSKLLHDDAHGEIREILSNQQPQKDNLSEKNVALEILKAEKKEGQEQHSIVEIQKLLEAAKRNEEQQHQIENHGEPADACAADNHVQTTEEALYSLVLPRAREVSQELISIQNAADRWELIALVWLEMLYYTAPRCGGAFHYEHLSTGGELVTHVLLLMHSLGPFLPTTTTGA
ncbi:unnamed protein product [Urochloa decumbens]|uniref:DUF4220 domain-containing protein n=1 Tax=Urochloa decumbens TaxID=240449 RepID=A0ABC9B5E7_9POAL